MSRLKTIYIIGAGSIGKVLAVFLANQGRNVILLRGSVDNIPDSFETIEVNLNNKAVITEVIHISTLSNITRLDGIIVLTNKSFGNADLAAGLIKKSGDSPVVILQNGLNIEQPFSNSGFRHIYRCVLFATSQLVSHNSLIFKPVSVSSIGVINGNDSQLASIVKQLDTPNFEFKAEENLQPLIWTKAIVNSVFNSVCPLLEIDNGVFHRNEEALSIAKRVIDECIAVAESEHVILNQDKVLASLLMISKSSDGQLISTYQDIKHKRRTEIDTLNFAICSIAEKMNMGNSVSETRLLGELVRIKAGLARA
ncbi:MAG: 2-dehydropantoate 2-reductase [Bacteroidota bacterium]